MRYPRRTSKLARAVLRLGELSLKFGRVDRITKHPTGEAESDTDHTVMLGLLACALAHVWELRLNRGLIAEFALIHDLVEVYAGDTPTLMISDRGLQAKARKEGRSRERLYREFNQDLPWIPQMITVYEAQLMPEARYVRWVDKQLPKITHILNGWLSLSERDMTPDALRASYEQQDHRFQDYLNEFPEVSELRRELVDLVFTTYDQVQSTAAQHGA